MKTMLLAVLAALALPFAGCRGAEPAPVAPAAPPAAAPLAPAPPPTPEPAKPAPGAPETPVTEAELNKLLADWQAKQAEGQTIVTRFVCVENLAILAKPRTTSGRIEIKKPDGYRRTTLDAKTGQPRGLMILKPPDLWVFLPDLKEAEHYDLARLGGKADANPLKALGDITSFDAGRIRKRFAIKAFKEADGAFRLEYVPVEGQTIAGVEKVRLWMKPGAGFPEKMETATGGGDVRLETYSETKFDEKLDDALFKFKPPAGVKMTEVAK
jgi:outer membrane lipoprotein-sorting protein